MANFAPAAPEAFVAELERLIRAHILDTMPEDDSGELAAASLNELLMTYGNWRARFVHAHPRTVHLASKLRASPKLAEHQASVDAIVAALEAGNDITPHLSRRITTAYVPSAARSPQLKCRRDLDLLIADWGLHHLHLTTEMEADGFVERTQDLLFAAFSPGDAYLIGIYGHQRWTEGELIEILVREWPDSSVVLPSISGLRLTHSVNEGEHLQLRQAGVATMLEVDGKVVMPGFGMTTAGTPLRVTKQADDMSWALRGLREKLDEQLSALDRENPAAPGEETMWKPWVDGDTWGVHRGSLGVIFGQLWQ